MLKFSWLIRRANQTGSSTPNPKAFGRAEKENPGLKVLSGKMEEEKAAIFAEAEHCKNGPLMHAKVQFKILPT